MLIAGKQKACLQHPNTHQSAAALTCSLAMAGLQPTPNKDAATPTGDKRKIFGPPPAPGVVSGVGAAPTAEGGTAPRLPPPSTAAVPARPERPSPKGTGVATSSTHIVAAGGEPAGEAPAGAAEVAAYMHALWHWARGNVADAARGVRDILAAAVAADEADVLPELDGDAFRFVQHRDGLAQVMLLELMRTSPFGVRAALLPPGSDSDEGEEASLQVLPGAVVSVMEAASSGLRGFVLLGDGRYGEEMTVAEAALDSAAACIAASRAALMEAVGSMNAGATGEDVAVAQRVAALSLLMYSLLLREVAATRDAEGEDETGSRPDGSAQVALARNVDGECDAVLLHACIQVLESLADAEAEQDSDGEDTSAVDNVLLQGREVLLQFCNTDHAAVSDIIDVLVDAQNVAAARGVITDEGVAGLRRKQDEELLRCSKLGNATASLRLAERIASSTELSPREASSSRRSLLLSAARSGLTMAMVQLAEDFVAESNDDALDGETREKSAWSAAVWFHHAAERHDPDAFCPLARCYSAGIGFEQDDSKAFAVRVLGAQHSCVDCTAHAGSMLISGVGVDADPERGVGFLLSAAQEGHGGAMVRVGQLLAGGADIIGIEGAMAADTHAGADPRQWFAQAAALGEPEALFELAISLKSGTGRSVAPSDAGDRFDLASFMPWHIYAYDAAVSGWVPAMTYVGLRMLTGTRFPKRRMRRALALLERAARSSPPDAAAVCALGIVQSRGRFTLEKELENGRIYLESAAELGSRRAQHWLLQSTTDGPERAAVIEADGTGDSARECDTAGAHSSQDSDDEVWRAIEEGSSGGESDAASSEGESEELDDTGT